MAPEILQRSELNRALPSNLKALAEGIANAASSQGKESLEIAIRSFSFVRENNVSTEQTFALLNDRNVHDAGFAEDPSKYFISLAQAKTIPEKSQLVSPDQILFNLRNHKFDYKRGVKSFLSSGIQEALASLKIPPQSNVPTAAPQALDELLSPQKLRNPDKAKIQSSVHVMNKMFLALKNLQSDVLNLQKNLFSSIRA